VTIIHIKLKLIDYICSGKLFKSKNGKQ